MDISGQGLAFIKAFEGLELEAYRDIVGVWTIGFGWTGPIGGFETVAEAVAANNGEPLSIGDAYAEELLGEHVETYANAVLRALAPGVALSQNQFDALVSLTYNIGVAAMKKSTFMRRLNNGDYEGCAKAMLWWNKAGGNVVAGLKRRREAEAALFLTPDVEVCPVDYGGLDARSSVVDGLIEEGGG